MEGINFYKDILATTASTRERRAAKVAAAMVKHEHEVVDSPLVQPHDASESTTKTVLADIDAILAEVS